MSLSRERTHFFDWLLFRDLLDRLGRSGLVLAVVNVLGSACAPLTRPAIILDTPSASLASSSSPGGCASCWVSLTGRQCDRGERVREGEDRQEQTRGHCYDCSPTCRLQQDVV